MSQRLRNSSHLQDNRYKLEDAERRMLCREGSELGISWTGKSVHDCYEKSTTMPLGLKPRISYTRGDRLVS